MKRKRTMRITNRRNEQWIKRVYGVLGISAIMANWNADFSGYPKQLLVEKYLEVIKLLKYPMKKMG